MRAPITIESFAFDDTNEDKFWQHGLTRRQVAQVLENPFVVARNRKARRARWLVVGRDNGGTCITIPVERTDDPAVWRPVTAWPCKLVEEHALARRERERDE